MHSLRASIKNMFLQPAYRFFITTFFKLSLFLKEAPLLRSTFPHLEQRWADGEKKGEQKSQEKIREEKLLKSLCKSRTNIGIKYLWTIIQSRSCKVCILFFVYSLKNSLHEHGLSWLDLHVKFVHLSRKFSYLGRIRHLRRQWECCCGFQKHWDFPPDVL